MIRPLLAFSVLALSAQAQTTSYLVDSNLDVLFTVDLTTGVATAGPSTNNGGLSTPADLTWRESTQELWTIDLGGGEVGTIDPATGTFTSVYMSGLSGWQGMAWDEATAMFYCANQSGDSYVLDPSTGMTTLQGPSTFPLITCLDVDDTGAMFGYDFFGGAWVSQDKGTGVASQVGLGQAGFQGLSYDSVGGKWYAANTNDDSLYTVDPVTGTAVIVGSHGGTDAFAKGFEVANGGSGSPPVVYCMAKVNSLGCAPAIGSTGSPSSTMTSGFTVDIAMVRNNKAGLFFYKANGAQAGLTFQCGTLCVGPSGIKRTPASNSGGNAPPANDCSGVYSLDFNAFAAGMAGGNPDPALLLMGTVVHCQGWGRDQGFPAPCNTTLSDGLEYTIN